ncbi:ankyrin repeat domain-containing protein [Dyella sp. 2HG41-7]|uniref:ankyrin repeat domain-containing protein n=1 Tax=Dyella sp. 2HG41-7 TaxID=2883239 RepID=UPI001F1F0BF3|nr:ankyrin repeat domain-containing protein [Dyella sp. 2HG41-7]
MNRNLFIHRVQLPQRERQEVSNDHTPIPGMNLFGPTSAPTLEPNTQQQGEVPMKIEHEDQRLEEARARFGQAFDQARDRVAELRELNLVQPSQTNEDLLQQSSIELPGGSKVSLIDFKDPMAPAIDKALAHQASNVDFDHATDETTPLHSAVADNKLGLVQRLLDHGADPNFQISEYAANADAPLVPLMRAKSPEMVDLLCNNGADVQKCLWHQDMLANPQVTQAFLDRGLHPNARTQEQHMDADESTQGESALHLAQDPEVARRLVLAGADIQANAGTREKPLSVTQKWAEDPESFGLIPVSKGPAFEQAVRDASAERQHLQHQQQENPVEKNMKPDEQMQRVPPTLATAVANGMVMPKRHASLGEAAAAATGQGKSEGEGQGGRQGGQERPSHSSYYNPVPVGGMAMPQRSNTIGDAVVQREAAQKRRRTQSI